MPMSINKSAQRGISLIELMVGVAISLILLAGILTVMLRISVEGGETVKAARLNQELRGALDFMTKDIQRAGYVSWFGNYDVNNDDDLTVADDANGDGLLDIRDFYISAIPAINQLGAVTLFDADNNICTTNCTCILYSYDLNEDGFQGVGGAAITDAAVQNDQGVERFGFRFDADTGEVQTMISGPHVCNSAGTNWRAINDSNVRITSFSLALTYVTDPTLGNSAVYAANMGSSWSDVPTSTTCVPSATAQGVLPVEGQTLCLWRRNVAITMAGQLADDDDVSVQLQSAVKIKNDYFNNFNP